VIIAFLALVGLFLALAYCLSKKTKKRQRQLFQQYREKELEDLN